MSEPVDVTSDDAAPDESAEGTGDEPGDFAADVEGLRADVDELASSVTALTYGITSETDALSERLDALHEVVTHGAVGPAGTKNRAAPQMWSAVASTEDWQELASWVDQLTTTYDLTASRGVLPCWPAHGGAVHELAALRSAWLRAAGTPGPDDALAYWHDRLLAPCLERLRSDYQMGNCVEKHENARPRRTTDRSLLSAALDDAAPTTADEESEGVDTSTGELA